MATPTNKGTWQVFWDLQCPYSKKNWEHYPALQETFGDKYDFSIHLCSLLFHPQAFSAQCAATLIGTLKGPNAKLSFIHAAMTHQERFMNEAVGDAKKSEIAAIFATIAHEAGLLDKEGSSSNSSSDGDTPLMTRQFFMANMDNWDLAVAPAWAEHKIALGYGIVGTPQTVINEKLVPDTESAWGPIVWEEKLKTL